MTTVTEIDRVAAANAISEHEGGWSRHCQQIVVGNADWDHVVQALAAHRIAAFEAGRVAGLEEAAKVADEVDDKFSSEWRAGLKASTYLEGQSDGAGCAAEAIRALKEKK